MTPTDKERIENLIASYNLKVEDFAAETRRTSTLTQAGRQMFEALHDCWLHDPANKAASDAMKAWEAADPNEAI